MIQIIDNDGHERDCIDLVASKYAQAGLEVSAITGDRVRLGNVVDGRVISTVTLAYGLVLPSDEVHCDDRASLNAILGDVAKGELCHFAGEIQRSDLEAYSSLASQLAASRQLQLLLLCTDPRREQVYGTLGYMRFGRLRTRETGHLSIMMARRTTADEPTTTIAGSIPRSNMWSTAKRMHLQRKPHCECCGRSTNVDVHHLLPYYLFPERELDPDNLMTLCGNGWPNCHFVVGHGGNWRQYVKPQELPSLMTIYRQFLIELASDTISEVNK